MHLVLVFLCWPHCVAHTCLLCEGGKAAGGSQAETGQGAEEEAGDGVSRQAGSPAQGS